jgi:hypothetical protein
LVPVLVVAGTVSCGVDAVMVGDPCAPDGDQACRTTTVALYCRDGHWFERDCWVECRYLGYEVGSCGVHSGTGDDTCFCGPGEDWEREPGEPCDHEGDQSCFGRQELRVCVDGRIDQVDCAVACAGRVSSACAYDPERGDESCVCCDAATCP